mgnify:CR=1 FL=1
MYLREFSTLILLSDPHHVVVVGGPVPLCPHDHALGAAHEHAFIKGLNPVPLLPHDLGAAQELNPGQVNDEQVPDHAEDDGQVVVPHVQVTAGESHVPGVGAVVPPSVQHLLVFLYRWEY